MDVNLLDASIRQKQPKSHPLSMINRALNAFCIKWNSSCPIGILLSDHVPTLRAIEIRFRHGIQYSNEYVWLIVSGSG